MADLTSKLIESNLNQSYSNFIGDSSSNNDLELQSYQGQKWALAIEVLSDFLASVKLDTVNSLSQKRYENTDELNDLLSMLRLIDYFERLAGMYIGQGKEAEQELNNG